LNLATIKKYLTLIPFDVSKEQGRSDERYRLVIISMVCNVMSRGTSMVVMIYTVSLTIPYLGVERFGVWMTIASFFGMLSFLDLGVGNALTNKVSQVAAQNNPKLLRKIISGGLGFLFILGCIIGVLLFSLTSLLPWGKLIKVKDIATGSEILNTIAVFSVLFGFSIFSNGIQRIFAGLQRAFIGHLFSLSGSILSLLFLWFATKQQATIPYLLVATFGVQSIANLGLLFILAKRRMFALKNIFKNVRLEAKHLLRVGGLFFILQIGTMIGWGADSLIIASTLGASQVAIFNIVQRLYQFISQPMAIINGPLWGAYADAQAHKDRTFIVSTLINSLLLTATCSIVGGGLLFLMSHKLITLWTKGLVAVPVTFVFMFFIWTICDTIGNAFAMMMNGCGIVREQVIAVLLLTTIALPVKLIVINNFGLTEMLFSYTVMYCLVALLVYGFFYKKTLIGKIGT
jgi:O-antigen/teichoic acid export membrane protein